MSLFAGSMDWRCRKFKGSWKFWNLEMVCRQVSWNEFFWSLLCHMKYLASRIDVLTKHYSCLLFIYAKTFALMCICVNLLVCFMSSRGLLDTRKKNHMWCFVSWPFNHPEEDDISMYTNSHVSFQHVYWGIWGDYAYVQGIPKKDCL